MSDTLQETREYLDRTGQAPGCEWRVHTRLRWCVAEIDRLTALNDQWAEEADCAEHETDDANGDCAKLEADNARLREALQLAANSLSRISLDASERPGDEVRVIRAALEGAAPSGKGGGT